MIIEVCDICNKRIDNSIFQSTYNIKKHYIDKSLLNMFTSTRLIFCEHCWTKIVIYVKERKEE